MGKIEIAWNSKMKVKERVFFFFLGLFGFVFCTYMFVKGVGKAYSFEEYINLISYSPFILLGFLFMTAVFDWNNSKVKNVLCGILGAFIMLFVLRREAQIWLMSFVAGVALLVIYKMLENVLVTITTFFLSALLLVPVLFRMFDYFFYSGSFVPYLTLVVYILIYRFLGFNFNKWILKKFGNTYASDFYNEKHFKNLLSLIYTVIFVIINISLYSFSLEDVGFNLINNSFLTSLAIVQLDWKNILVFINDTENKRSVGEKNETKI